MPEAGVEGEAREQAHPAGAPQFGHIASQGAGVGCAAAEVEGGEGQVGFGRRSGRARLPRPPKGFEPTSVEGRKRFGKAEGKRE